MPYTRDYFKQLALNLHFRLSDEEAQAIQDEFETLISQFSLLDSIDTASVEPMVYPNESSNTFLREDEPTQVLSHEDSLSNAPKSKNGYFVSKKVVI